MGMTRKFKTVDYEATLNMTVSLREALPPSHLARFVADVIAQLDLSSLYARYGTRGGEPFAPEILLGLLFYGYATGVFSARRIEKATYESLPFRFLAGDLLNVNPLLGPLAPLASGRFGKLTHRLGDAHAKTIGLNQHSRK